MAANDEKKVDAATLLFSQPWSQGYRTLSPPLMPDKSLKNFDPEHPPAPLLTKAALLSWWSYVVQDAGFKGSDRVTASKLLADALGMFKSVARDVRHATRGARQDAAYRADAEQP